MIEIDREVGDGPQVVYAAYFPSQRREDASFPMKIGMATSNDVHTRMLGAKAFLQEKPQVGLLMRTSYAPQLESALHSLLGDRHLKHFFGVEWFDTFPQEVEGMWHQMQLMDSMMLRRVSRTGRIPNPEIDYHERLRLAIAAYDAEYDL